MFGGNSTNLKSVAIYGCCASVFGMASVACLGELEHLLQLTMT